MQVTGTNLDLAAKLREIIIGKMEPEGTAASAAFIKDGVVVAACAAGSQEGDPAKPATVEDLFYVGSVSKIYCTMSIMKLVEWGKVRLDDPVTNYLPRFTMLDERYKQITIRHCLNHSSGLPGTDMKDSWSAFWLGKQYYEHFYDYLAKSHLKAAPGEFSVYCNDGFSLAEMIVAEVSGQSFTSFFQEHITFPLGAVSTCSGENNPANRVIIREKDKAREFINVAGTGGLSTDLIDCARMGYMFIDPQGLFTAESLAETAKLHSATFLPDEYNAHYGLGWDHVSFSSDRLDLGAGVLAKGGRTLSFGSHLIVLPKYNIAAAFSATNDCHIDAAGALVELIGVVLAELGSEAWYHPVPADWRTKYSGVYYSGSGLLQVDVGPDQLVTKALELKGWKHRERGAEFSSGEFVSGKNRFFFHEQGDCIYLGQKTPVGVSFLAQKFASFPPVHQAWQEKVGKKYILVDGHPGDQFLNGMCGVVILKPFTDGPLVFRSQFTSSTKYTSALSSNDR